jgi:hypothetical protein
VGEFLTRVRAVGTCWSHDIAAVGRSVDLLFVVSFLWPDFVVYCAKMKIGTWIKRLGFWGFLFFLVKGLLWLLVPALLAFWASS